MHDERPCRTVDTPYMAARTAAATTATATATPIMVPETEGRLRVHPVSIVPAGCDEPNRSEVRAADAAAGNLSQHEAGYTCMLAPVSVVCCSCRRSQGVERDCCAICRRLRCSQPQRASWHGHNSLGTANLVRNTLAKQQAAVQSRSPGWSTNPAGWQPTSGSQLGRWLLAAVV
jgi:hypothetical protein